jgi:TolB-like protein
MLKKLSVLVAGTIFAGTALANNHYKGYAPSDYTVFSPNQYANLENRYAQFSKKPEVYYSTTEGRTAAAQLNELSRFLMDQLVQNRNIKNVQDSRVAVTSFVLLDDLNKSNKFGVLLGEHMMHQLHVRGFKVIDFKSMGAIEIGSASDHVMTRDVSKLKTELNIHYALAGTVSTQGSGYVVNARLIDLTDQTIVATAQGLVSHRVHQVLNGEMEMMPDNVKRVIVQEPYPVHDNTVILRQR